MRDLTIADAEFQQARAHGVGLRREYAGEYETPAGRAQERGQKPEDHVRRQVGADEVGRSGRLADAADVELNAAGDAVSARVLFGYEHGQRVRVARLDARSRVELRGGDGEYPCARAYVEEASAAEVSFNGG